jgi:hypothetical protein
MTIDQWLDLARADLRRRSLGEAVPVVEALASARRVLRAADWNDALDAPRADERPPHGSGTTATRG